MAANLLAALARIAGLAAFLHRTARVMRALGRRLVRAVVTIGWLGAAPRIVGLGLGRDRRERLTLRVGELGLAAVELGLGRRGREAAARLVAPVVALAARLDRCRGGARVLGRIAVG